MAALCALPCYTLINKSLDSDEITEAKLKEDLENGDLPTKITALKNLMYQLLNGEKMPSLLMTIIRFVLPLQDHIIKKLLLIFWEIVPKTNGDGKLLQEMILVCDAYRKDLEHPNEFIRGSTLRFLCKLKEAELLEPLMPTIRSCLEHRHAYVRRNAVHAIFTIHSNFDFLIPDAPELIYEFLEKEQDASCRRNAFMMLIHANQEKALDYLSAYIDQVHSFNEILQLVIVELIYKVCISNPQERARFIKCIYNLLNSSSNAVRYEAAGTLVTLSSAPTAVKAAASTYIDLILKESDNNVKLIVLGKLIKLKETPTHEKILQELALDILRLLGSSDLEVRRKTLDLVLDLSTVKNMDDIVNILKKEVTNTHTEDGNETVGSYRQLLVRTLHSCCIKHPDVAPGVLPLLIEFLGDKNEQAALDVLLFVREAVLKFHSFKHVILEKLLENFHTIRNVKIHRHALWILGEHCTEPDTIIAAMEGIKLGIGNIPIVDNELRQLQDENAEEVDISKCSVNNPRKTVTADGSYATQSSFVVKCDASLDSRPPLCSYLLKGDFFIGSVIGGTLTKLALRFIDVVADIQLQNKFCAEAMLIMASIIHLGNSGIPEKPMREDDYGRLMTCVKVTSERNSFLKDIFNLEYRKAVSDMLEGSRKASYHESNDDCVKHVSAQPDDPIAFLQLFSKNDNAISENEFETSLLQAIGSPVTKKEESATNKLDKVVQLTGFSDPVYSEAYINVNQYDIVLDMLVVNQTSDTLQNVSLELATLGDLKLVEKPTPVTLAALDFCNIKASVKVTSTENGIIFGNICYDVSGGSGDRNCVVLNDIHIDVMDYIIPASCTDSEFRNMWTEFEWENKVSVKTNITDTREYLEHIIKCTNMKCLTPEKALSGDCGFLASNLYAKSIFGEDALANLSIEKTLEDGAGATIIGHIRIRAKTQGMALSLGDKINLSQNKTVKST